MQWGEVWISFETWPTTDSFEDAPIVAEVLIREIMFRQRSFWMNHFPQSSL